MLTRRAIGRYIVVADTQPVRKESRSLTLPDLRGGLLAVQLVSALGIPPVWWHASIIQKPPETLRVRRIVRPLENFFLHQV